MRFAVVCFVATPLYTIVHMLLLLDICVFPTLFGAGLCVATADGGYVSRGAAGRKVLLIQDRPVVVRRALDKQEAVTRSEQKQKSKVDRRNLHLLQVCAFQKPPRSLTPWPGAEPLSIIGCVCVLYYFSFFLTCDEC